MDEMRFSQPTAPMAPTPEKAEAEKQKTRKWIKKPNTLTILAILSIIILASVAVGFYLKAKNLESNPQIQSGEDVQKIVTEVSNLIVLPADEIPTVATVQDPTKLRGQPFFANAKEGYKVLVYANARKAILYDPIRKIIVEVAPLNVGDTAKAP